MCFFKGGATFSHSCAAVLLVPKPSPKSNIYIYMLCACLACARASRQLSGIVFKACLGLREHVPRAPFAYTPKRPEHQGGIPPNEYFPLLSSPISRRENAVDMCGYGPRLQCHRYTLHSTASGPVHTWPHCRLKCWST